jgi:hypothetical protein
MARRAALCATLLLLAAAPLGAQAVPAAASPSGAPALNGRVAVYLDCRTQCDFSLIRTEITYVNWVRDREVADVHILLTSQRAGAGGEQFTAAFLGMRALAGRGDTLTFTTNPTTTSDELRRGVTQMLSLGLVQFAARTAAAQTLRVVPRDAARASEGQVLPANDPWKAWVFSISLSGSTDGERYYKSQNVNSHLSADRVTEAWKTNFDFGYSYRNNRVTVQEYDSLGIVVAEETYENLLRDWFAEVLQVKSLGNHWSLGGSAEVASQVFRNQDLRAEGAVAVEYNLFPYSEATRRELVVRYGVGAVSYWYADTTIFDKVRETMPRQYAELEYRTREPWGSASVSVQHRNFLSDASKRTTEINAGFSVRLFKGFSVNANGGYEWIRDQVYLAKGEQDAVDVLLRRRALLSGFQYQMRLGVSYTFGSIYNNVVNPRF